MCVFSVYTSCQTFLSQELFFKGHEVCRAHLAYFRLHAVFLCLG